MIEKRAVFIDIETTGLMPGIDRILYTNWHWSGEAYPHICAVDNSIAQDFIDIVLDPGIIKVFHNAYFDLRFLASYNIKPIRPIRDTMVGYQMLYPHSVATLQITAAHYGMFIPKPMFHTLDEKDQYEYMCKDLYATAHVYEHVMNELYLAGKVQVFDNRCFVIQQNVGKQYGY